MKNIFLDETGQGMVEYSLITSVIVLGILIAFRTNVSGNIVRLVKNTFLTLMNAL